jgi:hypothetical protein
MQRFVQKPEELLVLGHLERFPFSTSFCSEASLTLIAPHR